MERRREKGPRATLVRGSEGGDVVECVVQLLADGLVLHLLCIDFVWGVQGRGARWECGEREWRERGMEGERVMERENKNQREVDEDGVRETGQRTGWTAVRAPSSPLCTPMSFALLCTPNWCFPPGAPASPRGLGAQSFA